MGTYTYTVHIVTRFRRVDKWLRCILREFKKTVFLFFYFHNLENQISTWNLGIRVFNLILLLRHFKYIILLRRDDNEIDNSSAMDKSTVFVSCSIYRINYCASKVISYEFDRRTIIVIRCFSCFFFYQLDYPIISTLIGTRQQYEHKIY